MVTWLHMDDIYQRENSRGGLACWCISVAKGLISGKWGEPSHRLDTPHLSTSSKVSLWWGTRGQPSFSLSPYKHCIWFVYFQVKISSALGARKRGGVRGRQHNESVSDVSSSESKIPFPTLCTSSRKPAWMEFWKSDLNNRYKRLWLIKLQVCGC